MSSSLAIKESPPSFFLCFVLCNLFPSTPCFIFSVTTRSDRRNPPCHSLHRSPLHLARGSSPLEHLSGVAEIFVAGSSFYDSGSPCRKSSMSNNGRFWIHCISGSLDI
ncbi:hypothetical protein HID58_029091 [Brassica napus]|uniref:Uncharacterized protein n=2 Tax=Brassica TaxID=3705 RepID=A0A8D9M4L3_BRACM|nr:hypothetical protein HID58_029091 [Brassica napus]CAF2227605.1 unnamed protein product [Brassica napus]CAG7897447.1 unnamed protein product [Brassica rapa]